ncbi:MAG: ion channel [Kovacikia sp.]
MRGFPESFKSAIPSRSNQRSEFSASQRLITPDGRPNIERLGLRNSPWQDLYHWLLRLPWPGFFSLIIGVYFVTNLIFAGAYLLGGDCIANSRPGSILDSFFFSVQTLATIGYGAMYPKTNYAQVLVSIEALVGLLGVAMITGLTFARFSRPTARVLFSQVAVISPFEGVPMLMFRAANQRGNQILEARLWVTLVRNEVTVEGNSIRRLHDLKLVRSQSPFFFLTWTAMHPIDEDSPLYGETPESLAESEASILVTLTGIDETVAQTVHARNAFTTEEILWNMRFVDLFSNLPDGKRVIDYRHFHSVMPLERKR